MKKTFVILMLVLVGGLVYSQYSPDVTNGPIVNTQDYQERWTQYYNNLLKSIESTINNIKNSQLPAQIKNSALYYYENLKNTIQRKIDELNVSINLPANCPPTLFQQYSDLVNPVSCTVQNINYGNTIAKIINVQYGKVIDFDAIGTKQDYFLQLPDGSYYRPTDKTFLNPWSSSNNVKQITNAIGFNPNHWTNLQIDKISTKNLIKRENNYCILYYLNYPFSGQVYSCENGGLQANIGYQNGIISWNDAKTLLINKLSQITDTQVRGFNWATPYSLVVFRDNTNGSINGNPYWAVTYRGYENGTGREPNYILRVFMDGNVQVEEYSSTKQMYPDELK